MLSSIVHTACVATGAIMLGTASLIPITGLYVASRARSLPDGRKEYIGRFVAARWRYENNVWDLQYFNFKGDGLTQEDKDKFDKIR